MCWRIRATKLGIMLITILLCSPCMWAASLVPPYVVSDNAQEEQEESLSAEESSKEETTPDSSTPHFTESSTTLDGTNHKGTVKCRWGEHCPDNGTPHKQDNHTDHLPPFVSTSTNQPKTPPEGFVITSRVYTDPIDKLAHFDGEHQVVLEYWECGVVGSTTSPLNVKHAYFRHALPRAAPATVWSGTEYGTHPQLLIPLKPLELLLNSGEEQAFEAGDVILLEDVIKGGHKIRSQDEDLSALLLTLPQQYHYVGKDRISLTSAHRRACQPLSSNSLQLVRIRKALFGSIGLGLSSFVAVFLGKVAPLWLSVGVGGLCFVTGGTYAAISCGEYVWQEVDLALERQRLKGEEVEEEEQKDERIS